MSEFLVDVIISILRRLPVKTLLRFKCVSKQFCSLIDDPYFIKHHLNCSIETNSNLSFIALCGRDKIFSVDLDSSIGKTVEIDHTFKNGHRDHASVVGAANGLVAFYDWDGDDLALFNPSTRRFRMLPRYNNNSDYFDYLRRGLFGFCHDVASDDYKLVRFSNRHGSMIYSLKANSWRRIKDHFPHCNYLSHVGVFGASAMHWLASKYNPYINNHVNFIIGFDIKREKFFHVPPPDDKNLRYVFTSLNVLRGCLSYCMYYLEFRHVDVWVMMQYGVKKSWTKLFSLSPNFIDHFAVSILNYSRCGKKVLFANCGKLHWYDLEKQTEESFKIHGEKEIWGPVTCVESLVSLDSL